MSEYPKALYLDGWSNLASYRPVASRAEEDAARAEGYKTLPEWPSPDKIPVAKIEMTVDVPPRSVIEAESAKRTEETVRGLAELRATVDAMPVYPVTTIEMVKEPSPASTLPPPKPDRFAAARAAKAAKSAAKAAKRA